MSNLLQFRNKIFCFVILFFICIFSVSGFKLSVSPAEINLFGVENQEICHNFTISSSNKNVEIKIYELWSSDAVNSRNLEDYFLNSRDLNLDVKYDSTILLYNKSFSVFCIIPHDSGKFDGVLFFESEEFGVSIGSFIHLNVKKTEDLSRFDQDFITGYSILNEFNGIPKGIILSLVFSFISLLILLFFMLELAKKRRERIY